MQTSGAFGGYIPADVTGWAAYGMTGYRLPFLGIMPFFLGQVVRGVGYLPIELNIKVLQFGVNIRALDEVVLKAEYHYILYDDPEAIFGFDTLQQFYTQIAWAF